MDARARTLLEAIAFGDGDDVRPADRLRAVELLGAAGNDYDQRVVDVARIFDGMNEADMRADVDQMAAAHVLEAWRDPDQWPAISQALRRILREARDSRESPRAPDHRPGVDGGDVATDTRAQPLKEAPQPVWSGVMRNPGEPAGVDPAAGFEVGWRRYS